MDYAEVCFLLLNLLYNTGISANTVVFLDLLCNNFLSHLTFLPMCISAYIF